MLISEIPTFVPSEKNTRGIKIDLDKPSSLEKKAATREEPQDPKVDVSIPENDDFYPEKKNKNRMRKKKKNAILNMPEGFNTTDALRQNGIYTKPLHKKLTPGQKKSMLIEQEMNDDYYDDDYTGLPAPVGGFSVDSFRHPKKSFSPLPSQREQFEQKTFFASQIANKKNSHRGGVSNDASNNWNNKPFSSFIENNSAPKDNKKSNQCSPSKNYKSSFKMSDFTNEYNYPKNRNTRIKCFEKKSCMQYQSPNTEHYSNNKKLQERELGQCLEPKSSNCSDELIKTPSSQSSKDFKMSNPADSSDLNAIVSLIKMTINKKDKKKRRKNLSAKDVLDLVQSVMKDNEDIESDLESETNSIEFKKISKKSKKKIVENNMKVIKSKKKQYHFVSDGESEADTSDTAFEYRREKKRSTKKEKTEKKFMKKNGYPTSDSDFYLRSEPSSSSESDSDFEYGRRYNKANGRKKSNLLEYESGFGLKNKRDRQRRRNKKEKKKMQNLVLKFESESSSDSDSNSDYYYKGANEFRRNFKNSIIRRGKERNDGRIHRGGDKRKVSKEKSCSNWNCSDGEFLMKMDRQRAAMKEMEKNYNQMKKEFLKMKIIMEGSRNKKVSNDITIEEPEAVISESDFQRYKPKLLTYSNSSDDLNSYKRKSKAKSNSMYHSDELYSKDKKKKTKINFKNISKAEHKFSSESEFDSDSYGAGSPKPEAKALINELCSDFEDQKKYRSNRYKKEHLKNTSDFSDFDLDSDSQFEKKKISWHRIKNKRQIKSDSRSFSSGSDSFIDYEEKAKKKINQRAVSDLNSDSDSDSGSDFYEVKSSSKGRSKPNFMKSADESFSDYEEKKSKRSRNVNRKK